MATGRIRLKPDLLGHSQYPPSSFTLGERVWLREDEQNLPSTVSSCAGGVVVFSTDYGQSVARSSSPFSCFCTPGSTDGRTKDQDERPRTEHLLLLLPAPMEGPIKRSTRGYRRSVGSVYLLMSPGGQFHACRHEQSDGFIIEKGDPHTSSPPPRPPRFVLLRFTHVSICR
ncbi:hypothetical protein WMY93_001094 [Mugilogobius chulae]|uniref:Myosin X N-terminal SH3 domain-containing protein n=1 Tax=Mugilogobius chulae TaxID=88201 RepID=A0AAW0Q186_9GOBI